MDREGFLAVLVELTLVFLAVFLGWLAVEFLVQRFYLARKVVRWIRGRGDGLAVGGDGQAQAAAGGAGAAV